MMSRPLRPDSGHLPFSSPEEKLEMKTPPEQIPLYSSPLGNGSGKYHLPLPLRLYDESVRIKMPGSAPTLQYASVASSSVPQRPSLSIQRRPNTAPSPSNANPRSPAPSMSNSSKKIRQIMGLDLSTQFFGQEDDGVSLASSGSVYSTDENGSRLSAQLNAERARDDNFVRLFPDPLERPSQGKNRIETVRNSEWSFSEDEQFCTRRLDEHSNRSSALPNFKLSARTDNLEDMATLNEMLFDELQRDVQSPVDSNYKRSLVDTRDLPLSPVIASPVSPLGPLSPNGFPKGMSKLKPIEVPKKPSFFANTYTRESYAWGSKYNSIPNRKENYL